MAIPVVVMDREFVSSRKGYEVDSGEWLDEKKHTARSSKWNLSRSRKLKTCKLPGFRSSIKDMVVS